MRSARSFHLIVDNFFFSRHEKNLLISLSHFYPTACANSSINCCVDRRSLYTAFLLNVTSAGFTLLCVGHKIFSVCETPGWSLENMYYCTMQTMQEDMTFTSGGKGLLMIIVVSILKVFSYMSCSGGRRSNWEFRLTKYQVYCNKPWLGGWSCT